MKRAAIYLRCSTLDQEVRVQQAELCEFAERRGWEYEIFTDRGQSGSRESRPALDRLLQQLRRKKFDVLVVWALDRLARSLRQLLTISEECKALGVDLVSLKQNLDTTLPAGKLTFSVLGAVAEFEREMLRTRVVAGMAQARRVGKHIGRPARRRLSQAEIEKIRLLRSQGRSVRQLAKQYSATQWMIARSTDRPSGEGGVTFRSDNHHRKCL
jgi:DNA invertase Pin-like site-specific DNA recombinase